MNTPSIQIGQLWKSKHHFPYIGYYTVEILDVGQDVATIRFTASEWEDEHWVENCPMMISTILSYYELIK